LPALAAVALLVSGREPAVGGSVPPERHPSTNRPRARIGSGPARYALNSEEFRKWAFAHRSLLRAAGIPYLTDSTVDALRHQIDTNGDGWITADELADFIAR